MTMNLSRKILNRLGDKPAQLAFRLSNTGPIRRRLGRHYDTALIAHRPALPVLSGIDRDVVDGLKRNGVFVTSLEALGFPGSAEMLESAQNIARKYANNAWQEANAGREFVYAPAASTIDSPEIFRWGLNERLLDIAESYIGLPVAYDGMALIYTVADGTELGPRQWHRDREDRKMLKVGVYCNDVCERGGPFQLISRYEKAQGDARGYEYVFGTEDELARRLGSEYHGDVVSCTGPTGTVVFADTARFFHRGASVYDQDRKAVFYSFFAQRTRHPFFCDRSGLQRHEIAKLTEGMSPRQRASALWQEALPTWLRMIPPAPV